MIVLPAVPLWQPWADLVVRGLKLIETRSWPAPPELRDRAIAIYATKSGPTGADMRQTLAHPSFRLALGARPDLPRGVVVGLVKVTHCELMTPATIAAVSTHEHAFGNYAPGRYAWHLTDAICYAEPQPATWPPGSRARWFDWPAPRLDRES